MERINLEFFINLEKEGKKSVIDFCIKMGFIAGSYECPECQKPMKLTFQKDRGQDGFFWGCKHKNFFHRRSIRSGSWFQDSRLSLIIMLKLAYLWVKKTPHAWIADEIKISAKTVCEWMAFFRSVCVNAIQRDGIIIGGPNEIVEIDAKSFFNVKNKQRGETWVFGGVERNTKKCFLEIIQSGEEDEIISILQKYVLPNTTIISDDWRGFDCLESNGYVHQKLSKASGFKDSVTGIHKNNILCLWGRLKKNLSYRICNDQLDAYLAEVMWRCLHQTETQGLLISFFKILNYISPRARDDPTYTSKKIEREKKGDNIKSIPELEFSENDFIGEIKIEANGDNNEGETQSAEVKGDNYEEENISVNLSENESMEEIEVPVMYSKNSSSEDEFESENGRQNKRQKTIESLDSN